MIFERLNVGPMGVNCYIVACDETKEAAVVDPGADAKKIMLKLKELGLKLNKIVLTHGHFDHIMAINEIREQNHVDVLVHIEDVPMLTDAKRNLSGLMGTDFKVDGVVKGVNDGDVIAVGKLEIKVIHTPGHTPGGICLLVDNILLCGDTLFYQSIGRTDFPGGSQSILIASIKDKLLKLSPDIKVYPGHGPETSIGHELKNNPFV